MSNWSLSVRVRKNNPDHHLFNNPGIGHTIHPNGDKFLVVVPEKEEVSDHFKIVLNFDALIEQKFAK